MEARGRDRDLDGLYGSDGCRLVYLAELAFLDGLDSLIVVRLGPVNQFEQRVFLRVTVTLTPSVFSP